MINLCIWVKYTRYSLREALAKKNIMKNILKKVSQDCLAKIYHLKIRIKAISSSKRTRLVPLHTNFSLMSKWMSLFRVNKLNQRGKIAVHLLSRQLVQLIEKLKKLSLRKKRRCKRALSCPNKKKLPLLLNINNINQKLQLVNHSKRTHYHLKR